MAGRSPWLFPGIAGNDDGSRPYSHSNFTKQLTHWQRIIGLHDETGKPLTVTAHQFRHTLGTRLINSGVPQHVVQRLLGHASPHMTSHYAKIHDATIREEFDRYQAQRVNIYGKTIGYDPDSPAASAEWVKHNLNRVRDSLPNGYCGRPCTAGLPAPERLPHLPGLPDHARVPADPPAAGRNEPRAHHPGRRQRPAAPRREPPPRPGQPGPDHPSPGNARE